MDYEFRFPQTDEQFLKVEGTQHLMKLLTSQAQYHNYKLRYQCLMRKDKYIYCTCCNCKARLTYRLMTESQQFHLTNFRNVHNHTIKHNDFNQQLVDLLKELPKQVGLMQAKHIARHKFSELTDNKFYYFFRKIRSPQLDYQELVEKLDKEHYEIQSRPFQFRMNDLPQLFIVVSPEMKSKYLKYGSFVTFDFTFHTIVERKQNKIYKLGALLGLSNCRKITPFGLVIALDQTKETFYEIFKSFGNIMGKQPEFYITDEAAGIKAALKQLQYEGQFLGHHALDAFHIIRNIKKRLIKKVNIKFFSNLLQCKDKQQYEQHLAEAYDGLQEQQLSILQAFDIQAQSTCFSHLPPIGIIGFSCSSGLNQKFHDLLKMRIPRELPFTKTVQATLSLMSELLNKCEKFTIEKIPIERYQFKQIKQVRYSIDKSVLQQFSLQLPLLIDISVREQNQQMVELFNAALNCKTILKKRGSKWICPCQYSIKSGIPCIHITRICIFYRISLLGYFDERWKLSFKPEEQIKRRSTGRKSRRRK